MRGVLFSMVSGLALVLSLQAKAESLRLGDAAYGGTGCPAGTASVTVSPDQQALSILFDSYLVEAGGMTGRQFDRKSCNISIPVHVPQGYSVAVFQADYRGFNALPAGGNSRFNAEYFWAGARGPSASRAFIGPVNRDFTLTNALAATSLVWAPCGASVNLRVNTSMMVSSNSAFDQAMASIDSADFSSRLVYHIQWKRCN